MAPCRAVRPATTPAWARHKGGVVIKYRYINENAIEVEDCKGAVFFISSCDIHLIEKHTWYVANTGYVERKDWLGGANKTIRLHREIMKLSRGVGNVDHVNMDKTDNRRENLRLATKGQNSINRVPPSNNTSGFTGVMWDKDRNRWTAAITVNRRCIRIGRFVDKEDAVRARRAAELKYFGEFSPIETGVAQ